MQETSVNAAKNPSVPRTETGNIKLNDCPDCGCPIGRHNAVLKPAVGGKQASLDLPVAHCGACGTCWTTKGTDFVERVRAALSRGYVAVLVIKLRKREPLYRISKASSQRNAGSRGSSLLTKPTA